ncbi:MAG: pyridoxal 5'-phosphate synthase glutaminase subunit PdxT [Candidatus Methanomethyliaceae archaeon]
MVRVGVLALQGDFVEHMEMLYSLAEPKPVRVVEDLSNIDALILPGGESTTIGRLIERVGLSEALVNKISFEGIPTLATCAGTVLLAKKIKDRVLGDMAQSSLGILDISILRNGFGRQINSFECDVKVENVGIISALFIRAPVINELWGSAKPIACIDHPKTGKTVVAVSQSNVIALTFHPEIRGDTKIYRTLISMAKC